MSMLGYDKNIRSVIKRDGSKVPFDLEKIRTAISKAFLEVDGEITAQDEKSINEVVGVMDYVIPDGTTVEEIQNAVEENLMDTDRHDVAKAYIIYRYNRALARKQNTTDESIMSLLHNTNKELAEENSNKNTTVASTQRDYIAGEVSRDLTRRILLPEEISKAHDEGILHFHDADYFVQPIFNCCLINIGDMLDNGTMINGKMVESPKGFQVACTVMTQIIANVASNQYGGQSVDISHLGKYLRRSADKFRERINKVCGDSVDSKTIDELVSERIKSELSSGVQTIQYQINTLMTTNGQSPFVTLFMHLKDDDPYIEENAAIFEQVFRQRLQGIKNASGVYITPAFPKLVYVLDENNCLNGGKYDYLTKLAVQCSAKRMYPDYISAKIMRETHNGNVYSPMGCVDGDEVITYSVNDLIYTESFERMWNRLSDYYEVKTQPNGSDLYMETPGVQIYDQKQGFVNNQRIIKNRCYNWIRVKFSDGRSIMCTEDHPFDTENRGVVLAEDLTTSDIISIDHTGSQNSKEIKYNTDRAWLQGFMLCDSAYGESITASIAAVGEYDIEEKFRNVVNKEYNLDVNIIERHRGVKGNYKDLYIASSGDRKLLELKQRLVSMFGGVAKINRHIPNEVFNWQESARLAFLAGMIDADGYINDSHSLRVQIGSTNKELAIQQMYLAQSLGMHASMYLNHYRANNKDHIRYRIEFIPCTELANYVVCKKKLAHFQEDKTQIDAINHNQASFVEAEYIEKDGYSYDVTTDSEHFTVSGIWSHNCRSFLTDWIDPDTGEYKYEGRFNQGVVSINLPQIALTVTDGGKFVPETENEFWKLLDERLNLCYEALMCRHDALMGTKSDVSPIHWQNGAIARLKHGETIDKYLLDNYSTISLGYIGIYETTKLIKGCSQTEPDGKDFALRLMTYLRDTCYKWRDQTGIGFSLYGTPAESLCYRFARIDKEKFGDVKDITDKGYYTNSYHVDVREPIDAFSKFKIESEFQRLSPGGAISYVEIPNMQHNLTALEDVVHFIYDNIQYAEFNTKSDYCQVCGYDGEIIINDDLEWECPCCGNKDQTKMNVTRRTCGYLGENFWNVGKTKEIKARVLHL